MEVTPVEVEDLWTWLRASGHDRDLAGSLRETVRLYGLDRPEAGNGQRRFSRRSYTCPFHRTGTVGSPAGTAGCMVPPEFKPYGCLAFNARRPGVRDGEDCGSDQDLLRQRETVEGEADTNAALARRHGFTWEKKALPLALLERLGRSV